MFPNVTAALNFFDASLTNNSPITQCAALNHTEENSPLVKIQIWWLSHPL